MVGTLLRSRRPEHHAQVTSVELFFDLVFVIAVTQISHALVEHLSWLGALEAALLLLAIWWAWIDTAWITNWLDPDKPLVRLMLFVLMGIGLVMSSSLPEAFGDRGLAFAIAFAAFQLGRTAFMLWAVRARPTLYRNFIRIIIWYAASAALWVVGGLAGGEARLICWLIAVALDSVSPALGFRVPGLGRADTRDWDVDGGHMAERSGLFVMIALGESVLVTGVGFTQLAWTPDVVLAMTVSLLQSIAMWWIFFGQHAEAASAAISNSPDPGRVARQAYTYVPILLVAGIVVSAVGDEIVLAHPMGHLEAATILVLIGGPALFLLGAALFKLAVFGHWSAPRFGGLLAILALYPLAAGFSPLLLSSLTTGIVVLVAVWEAVELARHPERYPAAARHHAE
ncbi:MAG: low temperature requirement protein A [Hyphomicrobiales bacterium]|jgi:low temperature requirement protein LtrA|nr:MAG: low temperature requirement protein A [Hyphomicrobiales bacterium]